MQKYISAAVANMLQADIKAALVKLKLDLPLYTAVGVVTWVSDLTILRCTDCI